MDGGREAADRCGERSCGLVDIDGCPPSRSQCELAVRLAALRRRDAEARVDGPAFVPAIVVAEEVEAGRARRERRATLEDGSGERPRGLMEIVLAGGRRVIVDGEVSVAALARVIDVLERR